MPIKPSTKAAVNEAKTVKVKKSATSSEFASAESVNKIALDFVRKLRKERQEE